MSKLSGHFHLEADNLNGLDIWDPFRKRRIKSLFDMFPEVEMRFPKQLVREPLIDVIDHPDSVEVLAEMPGVDKKDIDVNVNEHSVAISAEQKHEVKEEQEKKGYYFHERSFQKFYRSIPLPSEVIPEKTNAEFKAGILKLTLQKKKPVQPETKGFKVELK